MIDWDRLEAEVADVDASAAMTERVLAAARRRALRRRVACAGAALAGAAAVAGALLVVLPSGRGTTPEAATSRRPEPAGLSQTGGVADVRAEIYAAALAGGPQPQPLRNVVYVHDRVCRQVPSSPGGACSGPHVPAAVQADVRRLVGDQVRFAAQPPVPGRLGDPTVVSFGRLVVHGNSATLGMEVLCGPLCGQGETLVLRRADGQWQVGGTTGPAWIS